MITVRPADAIIQAMRGYPSRAVAEQEWYVVYEHFGRLFSAWSPRECGCVTLSGIRNCHPFRSQERAGQVLARLFLQVGNPWGGGGFLQHCGIVSWADLNRPLSVRGWRPKAFAARAWFDVAGRRLRRPGPNKYHPDALFAQGASLAFSLDRRRWTYRVDYGYPHDSSTWHVEITQYSKESRKRFAARVDAWRNALLEPEGAAGARRRQDRERRWRDVYRALDDLFYDGTLTDALSSLPDLVGAIGGASRKAGRIRLTKSRLITLERWARESAQ